MFGKKTLGQILAIFQILALVTIFSPASPAQKAQRKDKRTLVPETVFSNSTPITINTSSGLTTPTVAATYPSPVTVSGMAGNTTRVAVNLNGITHPILGHLDFLLVSPTGGKFVFASDMGGGGAINDKFITFADDAATTFPFGDTQWGPYRPTSGDGVTDVFPSPAPAGPYNSPFTSSFAATYNGVSPNGTWNLYVADDTLGTAGSINAGWSLTVTTDSTAATTFDNPAYVEVNDITSRSTPYGTQINVSGMTGVISDIKVILNGFSHTTPQDVDMMLVSPDGKGLVVMSDAAGTIAASGANITIDDAAANFITSPLVTGSYKPTDGSAEVDTFQPPAPYRLAYGSGPLASFNGVSPNGNWTLFVVDDAQNNSGSISGGWSLDITTIPTPPPTPASCVTPSFSPNNFAVGTNPTNAAVADFNNDTKADLAVTNQTSNDVSILLGDGSGGFAPQTSLTAGSSPYAVAAGLFNADSNVDLAVANATSNNVSILLGNGDGTFSAATNFFAGSGPISIAVGDFNNDTKQDLAVANFGGFFVGSVSILLGNGSGGFTAGSSVRTRTQPSYVAVVSISGDANQDLVVANFGSDSVGTFFGNGSGGFTLSQNISTGSGPVAAGPAGPSQAAGPARPAALTRSRSWRETSPSAEIIIWRWR
jgi:subtilisin-like proprotein convertase family protein